MDCRDCSHQRLLDEFVSFQYHDIMLIAIVGKIYNT